eukprot:1505409-Amphidinium_carterae.1
MCRHSNSKTCKTAQKFILNHQVRTFLAWISCATTKAFEAEMQGLQEAKSYLARGEGDVPFEDQLAG